MQFWLTMIWAVFALTSPSYAEDVLTIGVKELPKDLHPLTIDQDHRPLLHLWQTPLVQYDAHRGWQCGACRSFPSFTNKKAAMVKKGKYEILKTIWEIDKDVRWGDGTPVTAQDFALSWDIISTMRIEDASAWTSLSEIYDVDVGGHPRELVIWFGGRTPNFTRIRRFFPIPHQTEEPLWLAAERVPRIYFSKSKMGTSTSAGYFSGSFTVQSHSGDQISLRANPHKKPVAKEASARILAMNKFGSLAWAVRNNIVHIIPEGVLSYDEAIDLQKQLRSKDTKGSYQFRYEDSKELELIGFNLRNPLLSDTRMRRALSYATNRERLVNTVFARTKAFDDTWSSALTGKEQTTPWRHAYSRKKAKALLNDLGWELPEGPSKKPIRKRDERSLTMRITVEDDSPTRLLVAQELQRQWAEVGIAVTIDSISSDNFAEHTIGRADFSDVVLMSVEFVPDVPPRSFFYGKSIPSFENNYTGQNIFAWHERDVDEAIDQWEQSYNGEDQRDQAQAKLIAKIQTDVPFIPLFRVTDGAVVDARIQGFKIGNFWGPSTQGAHLWQWSKTTAINP